VRVHAPPADHVAARRGELHSAGAASMGPARRMEARMPRRLPRVQLPSRRRWRPAPAPRWAPSTPSPRPAPPEAGGG
jgi:hypothetical protein